MNKDEMIEEAINNIIKETKCFNCIHAPICFAQKGGVNLQLASGLGCYYYQAKIADDEMVVKKSEYEKLSKDYAEINSEAYYCGLSVGKKEAKQETRDILQELKNKLVKLHSFGDERVIIELLAEEHGIELE